MFEMRPDEVAGADVATLAGPLLRVGSLALLGSELQAAQAVVAAAQKVIKRPQRGPAPGHRGLVPARR